MLKEPLSNVLAIETSTQACSVALIHEGREIVRHELLPQKHAHRVLEMVEEVMAEAQIKSDSIDLLAYGEGPGAFTGIRIASGVIQGLALGWDKPVLAVSSLLAMAEQVTHQQAYSIDINWCVLLDARMNEVYLLKGKYLAGSKKLLCEEPLMLSPSKVADYVSDIGGCVGLGDVSQEYPDLVSLFSEWHSVLPEAISVARIAIKERDKSKTLKHGIPNPLYLRNHIADTIEERKIKALAKK